MRAALRIVLATALVIAAVTGLAPTASADNSHCASQRFCLFDLYEFKGGTATLDFSRAGAGCADFHTMPYANIASSMINNTGRTAYLYTDPNCHGYSYKAVPHSEDSTFKNNPHIENNVESIRLT